MKAQSGIKKTSDGSRTEGVPSLMKDWFNYGEITRSVKLIETEQSFIQDYYVQLTGGRTDLISGWLRINGQAHEQQVMLRIPGAGVEKQVQTISIKKIISFTLTV